MIFWVQHGVVSLAGGQYGDRLAKVVKTSFENERGRAIEI
jgi:hypothetical protein